MKILKIKKGFITNSSGSYEWLPINTPSEPQNSAPSIVPSQPTPQPNNQSLPATPSNNITQKPHIEPNGGENNAQKNSLDPNVALLAVIVIIIAVIATSAEIVKKILMRMEKDKKNGNRKRNDHN